MTRVDPKQLVFVDESGANTKMVRTHGWTLRGPTQSRFTSDQLGGKFADDWRDTALWSRSIAYKIRIGEWKAVRSMDLNLGL